jgi:hypothetical protein
MDGTKHRLAGAESLKHEKGISGAYFLTNATNVMPRREETHLIDNWHCESPFSVPHRQ